MSETTNNFAPEVRERAVRIETCFGNKDTVLALAMIAVSLTIK